MSQEMQPQMGEIQPSFKMVNFANPGVIMRERSFMRPHSHHAYHNQIRDNGKRRSMIVASNGRGKPSLEIYRPPGVRSDVVPVSVAPVSQQPSAPVSNSTPTTPASTTTTTGTSSGAKLNVHAKEFTMTKPIVTDLQNRSSMNAAYSMGLQHSRSSGAVLHQGGGMQIPTQYRGRQMNHGQQILTSPSGSSINSIVSPRVTFKLQPNLEKKKSPPSPLLNGNGKTPFKSLAFPTALKRSKSLTSADTLATGMAAMGLAVPDSGDLGTFPPDVQECIDKALEDPNSVPARTLMDAVGHIVGRAAESPRYALPAARRCIAVVEREHNDTFLESLLNTCQLWYQERDKRLNQLVNGGRPRLMAFLSFLLEMYCQVRRRAVGRRPQNPQAAAAACTLLTLIARTCESCVRQPVPSASDTENLFFVLTYIGRDLESQLPAELEKLLTAVRDAFLNSSSQPSIRKTLLQLIELHASRWQLPGCAVLYYYPSSK